MKRVLFLLLILLGLDGLFAQTGEVYVGIITFHQNVRDLTGGRLVLLNQGGSDLLARVLENNFRQSEYGTSLYYAVHTALANLTSNADLLPANLASVNIITVTGGLDNNSTNPALPPLEGQNFFRSSEYLSFLQHEIANRTIRGVPIKSYVIGIRGKDVADTNAFITSVNSLSSTPSSSHARILTNHSELSFVLDRLFDDLSGQMMQATRKVVFKMNSPAFPLGTKIRLTFDMAGINDPTASRNYLEGIIATYDRVSKRYQLENITYHGSIFSTSGVAVYGTYDRMVTFNFNDFEGFDVDNSQSARNVRQWTMPEGNTRWIVNSEFSPDFEVRTLTSTGSMVIYLVLDTSVPYR